LSIKRSLLLGFLLTVSALALAACGSSESDEDKVADVIETSITTNDPANCTTLETQTFVEQGADESGKAAVKDCEEEAEDDEEQAESVEVTEVEVDGEDATANAAITGGGFDGQTLSVALVKDGDQWKLDEVTGIVKLDNAALVKTLEKQFEDPEIKLSEAAIECILGVAEEADTEEVEELLLSGSSEVFVELAEVCSES
jgi:ABC-type glycerol-3-phosphate transport system substrate-binding protein